MINNYLCSIMIYVNQLLPFMWLCLIALSLADPGGRTRRPPPPPPNGRGPLIFSCPKRYFFSHFFSLASLAINLTRNLIEIWPKHAKKIRLLQRLTLLMIDKVHAPPPKVKSWIRHCL